MPKSKDSNLKVKEIRKQNLLNSALKVFCEKGYESTTVDDIVQKAECSHGLFYHYFKNKQEVFAEVLRFNENNTKEIITKKMSGVNSYIEKLRVILDSLYNDIKNDENYGYYFYLFISQGFPVKNTEPSFLEKDNPTVAFENFEKFFKKGQEVGEFNDKYLAKDYARLFLSIIKGSTLAYILAPKQIKENMKFPETNLIIDIFKKGV